MKLRCSSSSLLKLECLLLKKRKGWREKGKRRQVIHWCVCVLAGIRTAPLQTLASPEDLAWPSQVRGSFVPAHWEVDTWGGGAWAVSMALGRCRVFFDKMKAKP